VPGVKLNQEELSRRVRKIALEVFGMVIKEPVIISNRMTRSWGRYYWRRTPKTKKMRLRFFKFSSRLVNGDYPLVVIDDCIKHELTHWYTDKTEGRPCHHNHKFYANCRRFGVTPSRISNYQKAEEVGSTEK